MKKTRKEEIAVTNTKKTSQYIVTKYLNNELEITDLNGKIVFSLKSDDYLGCVVRDDTILYLMEKDNYFYDVFAFKNEESQFVETRRQ